MSYRVCLSHSESFLEASSVAQTDGTVVSRRYYLPKMPLEKAITDFWNHIGNDPVDSVILSLKACKTILKKRLGTPPALIVTEGFENWLNMNLPVETKSLTMRPARVRSPLNSDLVFGLHERTDANGKVLTPVNEKELEFLVSKLQMSKVDTVSICFLHSNKNPTNENTVKSYFSEKGFRVFPSSAGEKESSERERWLSAVLGGYLDSTLREELERFLKLAPLTKLEGKIHLATGNGFVSPRNYNTFSTLLGDVYLLHQIFSSKSKNPAEACFYFGLEECLRLFPTQSPQNFCNTELGNVSGTTPSYKTLDWSFTQPLKSRFWGIGQPINESIGYEPGPMCFGRGLQPTLLDLLFLENHLKTEDMFSELTDSQTRPRIFDALSSLVKDLKQELLNKDLLQNSMKILLFDLASDISNAEKCLFLGPMAEAMQSALKSHYQLSNIELLPQSAFPTASAVKISKDLS